MGESTVYGLFSRGHGVHGIPGQANPLRERFSSCQGSHDAF